MDFAGGFSMEAAMEIAITSEVIKSVKIIVQTYIIGNNDPRRTLNIFKFLYSSHVAVFPYIDAISRRTEKKSYNRMVSFLK